ncbi:hypothetical protein Q75_08040 [Bacillus coahuilensis p1.1.43]|uniref:YitT family protein n=1 Tax=Bacillus coahuilensis p1.1.43 TaxID=1150625 RepID=A0A147K8E1_9BACI|nr:YitT family protein [Bacillus coahuilensis]KUP06471.1 hypothetical protein Q75_08040 [Bacillus coahuilensis p1.1.43]
MRKTIFRFLLGSILVGIGINFFFLPHHLLDGGMIGIGLISYYWLGIKPGLAIIVLSIPLYIISFFHNRQLFFNSIHGLWLTSFCIDVFHLVNLPLHIPVWISIFLGGITVGGGIGLLIQERSATGGIDLIAQVICDFTKWNVGIFILVIDIVIILIGASIIEATSFLYSLLAVVIVGLSVAAMSRSRNDEEIY